jgi:hypothetical protein
VAPLLFSNKLQQHLPHGGVNLIRLFLFFYNSNLRVFFIFLVSNFSTKRKQSVNIKKNVSDSTYTDWSGGNICQLYTVLEDKLYFFSKIWTMSSRKMVDTFTKTVVEFDEEAPKKVKSCYTNK